MQTLTIRSVVADLDDSALVGLALRRDIEACRFIIQTHNIRLYRVARGILGDDSEAEDAVQDAYVQAFTHLSSFPGEAQLATWLTRIVINEALGRLRAKRPTVDLKEVDQLDELGAVPMLSSSNVRSHNDPEAAAARTELRHLLEHAIDALPDPFRTVFVLRDVQELSVEETAAQLNLRPESVRTRLFRARRILRASLGDAVGSAILGAFPFGGDRCARTANIVLLRLKL